MSAITIVLFTFLAINYINCLSTRYKLCVTQSQFIQRQCRGLELGESQVSCVMAFDSVDCAFKLKSGEAHFAVFTSEQIALNAPVLDIDTVVIYQFQNTESRLQKYKYRTGVIVEKSFSGTLESLKGMKYCHPGFEQVGMNDRVMKVFESKVVPPQCFNNISAIENELSALANFFNNGACRPRKWTEDDDKDKILRKKYKTLCDLCDDIDDCKNNPEENNHHRATLRCLTRLKGQVAYVNIEAAKEYFQIPAYKKLSSKYSYLCPNATKMDLDVDEPCAWYEEPFDAVVASREFASDITRILKIMDTTSWGESLRELMPQSTHLMPLNKKPTDYVSGVIKSLPNTKASCGHAIKWCTTSSSEQAKCTMLQRASHLHAVKPALTCVLAESLHGCLNETSRGNTDVMGLDTNLAYMAFKNFELQPVRYLDPGEENLYKTVAIIKSGAAKSFKELKGKDAFFPEFGGIAHLTIFEKFKNDTKSKENLNGDLLRKYFHKLCIPRTSLTPCHSKKNGNDSDYCKLCCGDCCAVNIANSSLSFSKAIEFLVNNSNSVSFINSINIHEIQEVAEKFSRSSKDQFAFLCKNDHIQTLNQSVDETCAFSSHLPGMIIKSMKLTNVQKEDINLALLKLDELFGFSESAWLFNMYGPYNGEKNLLLKGKKLASETNKHVTGFESLIKSVFKDDSSPGYVVPSSTSSPNKSCSHMKSSFRMNFLPAVMMIIAFVICLF